MTVKSFGFFLLPLLLLSSCATLFNDRKQFIHIHADPRISNIRLNDSITPIAETSLFYVSRSKKTLKVSCSLDSTIHTINLKAHSSFAYWVNIYFNAGLGMLIDLKNPKRFSYPSQNYLSVKENTIKRTRFEAIKKGTLSFTFSLPHINFFQVKTNSNYRTSAGFWGVKTGMDYYYRDNRYLSANVGCATDFPVPVPAAVDFFGEFQSCNTKYINIRNNHVFGRFELGYGLNLSTLRWRKSNTHDSILQPQTFRSNGLGLSCSAQFRCAEHFRIGFLYQPNLISFNYSPHTDYQHYMAIEFIWKFIWKN